MYRKKYFGQIVLPLLVLATIVAIWQLVLVFDVNHRFYLLPKLDVVLTEFTSNIALYLREALLTGSEALIGFLVGNLLSFALAVWMSYSRTAKRIVFPYAIILKTTPIVALAPLIVAIFGQDLASKIVCAAVISFFPLLIQTPDALRRVPNEWIDLFHSFGASERQTFFRLRLPMAIPEIFSALKTASSLSLIGALMGEFISPSGGLGKLLTQALANGWAGQLVVATILCGLMGMLFFGLLQMVQKAFFRWITVTT